MNMRQWIVRLVQDDHGGEVMEYVLIAGLIIIGAIAAITQVGTKTLGWWTTVQNSL